MELLGCSSLSLCIHRQEIGKILRELWSGKGGQSGRDVVPARDSAINGVIKTYNTTWLIIMTRFYATGQNKGQVFFRLCRRTVSKASPNKSELSRGLMHSQVQIQLAGCRHPNPLSPISVKA